MSRFADAILGDNEAYGKKTTAPMIDVSQAYAGQQGFMPNYEGYVSNAAYVKRNLIAVLVEAPRGFQDLPNPEKWVATLKSLVELQSKSIEGLQNTLETEWAENAVGGAGEMQEDIANVTRSRSTPTHVWTEKYGKAINAFLSGWITGLLMDPNTKVPTVVSRTGAKPTDLLPDYTGMTVLYFEPDPTHTKVVTAWLCTNMHPKTAGEITGHRDLTQAGESVDYSVEFTALTQVGAGVNTFAQSILDSMNLTGVNPNMKQAFVQRISEEVDSDASPNGYVEQVNAAAQSMVG